MNLHNIVRGFVGAINPQIMVSIQVSKGYTTGPSGKRTPLYEDAVSVRAQMQPIGDKDLRQLDSLNIQGETRVLYLNGNWDGITRLTRKGGDLVTLPDNTEWLVVMVLENWASTDGWVKVAITQQIN